MGLCRSLSRHVNSVKLRNKRLKLSLLEKNSNFAVYFALFGTIAPCPEPCRNGDEPMPELCRAGVQPPPETPAAMPQSRLAE
jgi:hypothetical protein